MPTAYRKTAQRAIKESINAGKPPPLAPTGYALDAALDLPVRLDTLIGDTFPDVTASDVVLARLQFPELMEMSYAEAMKMPYVVANGPVRACLQPQSDTPWHRQQGEIMRALATKYREGMNGRHTGATG